MNKKRICLILGFVCLLLTLAVVVQIRTINSKISSINPAYVDNDLRDEVLRTKEEYEEKFKELETAQVDLETKRAEATENDEESAEKEQEVKISEAILGTTDGYAELGNPNGQISAPTSMTGLKFAAASKLALPWTQAEFSSGTWVIDD